MVQLKFPFKVGTIPAARATEAEAAVAVAASRAVATTTDRGISAGAQKYATKTATVSKEATQAGEERAKFASKKVALKQAKHTGKAERA